MTKEYKTVSSMLLMLIWRTSKESLSNTLIILATWPVTRREIIFNAMFEPEILASTSATGELQQASSSLKTLESNPKGRVWWSCCWGLIGSSSSLGLGTGLGLILFLLFLLDSNDCKTWCISFINSITPPIIDAWSPYTK